jgi:hypothetical protein
MDIVMMQLIPKAAIMMVVIAVVISGVMSIPNTVAYANV